MPRYSRNLPAGSIVHVVNRGNDKRVLFRRAQDFDDFLGLVVWAKSQCPVRIVAYCVMTNHWHFVFWVQIEWDVSAFVHRLAGTHAMRWRKATNTIGQGTVYQSRFKSCEVLSERYYYNVIRYVEQNPLRANLVRSAADWRWSSLAERLGNRRQILDPDPLGISGEWFEEIDRRLPSDVADDIRGRLKRY